MSGESDRVAKLEAAVRALEGLNGAAANLPSFQRVPPVWRDTTAITAHISAVLSLLLSVIAGIFGTDLGLGAYADALAAGLALFAPVAYLAYGWARSKRQAAVSAAQGQILASLVHYDPPGKHAADQTAG